MGFIDKVKGFVMGPDDNEYEDYPQEEYEVENDEYSFLTDSSATSNSFEAPRPDFGSERQQQNKVVDFHTSNAVAQRNETSSAGKPHVVVAKLEKFEDVTSVTKSINEKRMVIINLEDAANDISQRIIDFIYGVTIANKAELIKVGYRIYMIKPFGYNFTGKLDGDFDVGNFDGFPFK